MNCTGNNVSFLAHMTASSTRFRAVRDTIPFGTHRAEACISSPNHKMRKLVFIASLLVNAVFPLAPPRHATLQARAFPAGRLDAIPAGKNLQIVFLGDSLTEGTGDDSQLGGGYPRRVMQQVQSKASSLNVGESGWDLEAILTGHGDAPSEVSRASEFLKSDPSATKLVYGLFGSNDLWYLYEYGNPTPAEEEAAVILYRERLIQLSMQLMQAGASRFVFGLLDDQSQRPCIATPATEPTFTGISNTERTRMGKLIPTFNMQVTLTCHTLALLGASCAIVDLYSTDIFTNPLTISQDGNHPNAAGYDSIAKLFHFPLQSALE